MHSRCLRDHERTDDVRIMLLFPVCVASCRIHATALTSKCIYCVHDSTVGDQSLSHGVQLCATRTCSWDKPPRPRTRVVAAGNCHAATRRVCRYIPRNTLSLSLSLSLSLCVSLHVYSRSRARERTTLVYIAVSDTWASSKSIPVQGVSVESQLAPRRLTTPRSRETTLVAELCVAGALPPFEKVASSVNWKFYIARVSILILLSYPFLIPRGFSFSMERKVKKIEEKGFLHLRNFQDFFLRGFFNPSMLETDD